MAESKWLTTKQMATFANVNQSAVNNWITRGKIAWKREPKYDVLLVDRTSLKTSPRKKRVKST